MLKWDQYFDFIHLGFYYKILIKLHYLLFQEQIQIAKREEEKRLKRIYDNWKRLINGMLVKQKIKERYGVSSSTEAFACKIR